MKRMLFEGLQLLPYNSDMVVDRLGALSSVLAVTGNTAATEVTVTLTHCETEDGTFTPALDTRLFLLNTQLEHDSEGKITKAFVKATLAPGGVLNFDIDLLACRRYVKIKVECTESATVSCALALGDFPTEPIGDL